MGATSHRAAVAAVRRPEVEAELPCRRCADPVRVIASDTSRCTIREYEEEEVVEAAEAPMEMELEAKGLGFSASS